MGFAICEASEEVTYEWTPDLPEVSGAVYYRLGEYYSAKRAIAESFWPQKWAFKGLQGLVFGQTSQQYKK